MKNVVEYIELSDKKDYNFTLFNIIIDEWNNNTEEYKTAEEDIGKYHRRILIKEFTSRALKESMYYDFKYKRR